MTRIGNGRASSRDPLDGPGLDIKPDPRSAAMRPTNKAAHGLAGFGAEIGGLGGPFVAGGDENKIVSGQIVDSRKLLALVGAYRVDPGGLTGNSGGIQVESALQQDSAFRADHRKFIAFESRKRASGAIFV